MQPLASRCWVVVMPAELQTPWHSDAARFAASLLDAEQPAPEFLTSASGINDARRFAVYKNNVTVSLVRSLEANFPAIVKLVGDEYFTALAHVFVEKHPPKTRVLAQYGAAFPAFLQAFAPLFEYPYLCDVAQLEQLWREAFHEADALPIAHEQLALIAPDDIASLRFIAHPATRLLHSKFAAGSIFSANRSDGAQREFDPAMGEYALITRPHFDCALRILNAADGAFVNSLLSGETLQEAIEHAIATREDFDLASSISGILEAGAFCEFSIC
jgi:Putative DNA-binding domain